jgi:hypothetical protein
VASSVKKADSHSLAVEVKIKRGSKTSTSSELWNTSLGGVFIGMKDPLAFGSDVQLEFSLPSDPRTIRCEGFVISTAHGDSQGKNGINVRLTSIGIAEMRHLARCVGRDLG